MIATQIRAGMIIIHKGQLCRVTEMRHVTPGKGAGMVQAKMKDIRTGTNVEFRFRPGEKIEKAHLERRELEYLYDDGQHQIFMDSETYEQFPLDPGILGDGKKFLIENMKIIVEFHEGSPVGAELPQTVDLRVEDTPPAIKGATASAQLKPATLENGLKVQVPSFVGPGDVIRVDTSTGDYMERA